MRQPHDISACRTFAGVVRHTNAGQTLRLPESVEAHKVFSETEACMGMPVLSIGSLAFGLDIHASVRPRRDHTSRRTTQPETRRDRPLSSHGKRAYRDTILTWRLLQRESRFEFCAPGSKPKKEVTHAASTPGTNHGGESSDAFSKPLTGLDCSGRHVVLS